MTWNALHGALLSQGKMGFSSAGVGCGCSFFFELPLYSQPPLPPSGVLPPSSASLELFSQAEIEPPDVELVSVISDHSLAVDHNGVEYVFSPEKHGSQKEVRADSSSVLFDHVFQQMLLPQIQYPSHKKGEMKK